MPSKSLHSIRALLSGRSSPRTASASHRCRVLALGVSVAALTPTCLQAADFFVVQANGASGAYTSVNDAIAAAVGSAGGASGDIIEIRSNTAGTLQEFAQGIDLSSVNISSTSEANWLTIRVCSGDRVRFRTTGTLLSATGTSRGWKLEGNSLGYESLQFGRRSDFVHTGLNTYETCYPQTYGANIASTCSNYRIKNAQFTGARSYYANNFDGSDYELDTVAVFDHGTNHYDINPSSGNPQDWGNAAVVRGVRVKLQNLTGLHGGHEGWGFQCRNSVVRNSDFSGYWGDISPSAGSRATSVENVRDVAPYGPILMEGVIVRDSGNSVDQSTQAGMKTEANRLIIRDSFYFDIDSHLWQMNFAAAKASSTSYFSGHSFYHNTSYISKGTWWSNFSGYNSASGNAQFENNLISNNLFQQVSDNDKTSSPAQILQYDTSLITLNGFPNGFHGTVISGNAVGGPSPLKQVNLKVSGGNTTFAIDSPPSSPVNLTGNVFGNVITAVTFDDVGSPRARAKAGFAVTNWGSGASAGDAPRLTTIASSSSGATITVANSRPFYDGWGIRGEVGDYIYVGSSAASAESAGPVQISSINYSTHAITLTSSRSVTSGHGVWYGGNPANGGASIRKNRGAHIPGTGGSPPSAPTNLGAAVDSSNPSSQINLSWVDTSSNETQFVVERKLTGGSYGSWSVNKAANSTGHNDTTVAASTSYTYRVKADNSAGSSAWSNEASATTSGGGTPSVFDANSLSIAASTDGTSPVTNSDALGGNFLRHDSNAPADYITFNVTVPATQAYQVSVRFHRNAWRGITQLAINNGSGFVNQGATQDLYAASAGFMTASLGTVSLTAGTRQFRFTMTGKHASSGDYELGIDTITLTPASDGLGVWLKFDDGSGTSAADSSGSGNTGTLVNGATWTTGQLSGAVNLDGTNDHVALPSGQADFTNGMTIAVWAYPETVADAARFIDFGNGSASNNIILSRAGTTNNLRFRVYNGSTAGTAVDATGAISLNTWQHFAVTIDSSGSVKIYKNGAQVATGTTSAPANVSRSGNYIGRSNWSTDDYYDGKMDDLRIYDRVLTATEIAALP